MSDIREQTSSNAQRILDALALWFDGASGFSSTRDEFGDFLVALPRPRSARFQFNVHVDPSGDEHHILAHIPELGEGAVMLLEDWASDRDEQTADFIEFLERALRSTSIVRIRRRSLWSAVKLWSKTNSNWQSWGECVSLLPAMDPQMRRISLGLHHFGSPPVLS